MASFCIRKAVPPHAPLMIAFIGLRAGAWKKSQTDGERDGLDLPEKNTAFNLKNDELKAVIADREAFPIPLAITCEYLRGFFYDRIFVRWIAAIFTCTP